MTTCVPDTVVAPGLTPRRTGGWELAAYGDNSAAFVFTSDPVGVSVLDRVTWLVVELCDGRTAGEIADRVAGVLGDTCGRDARLVVDRRLQGLAARGLIAIETGASG